MKCLRSIRDLSLERGKKAQGFENLWLFLGLQASLAKEIQWGNILNLSIFPSLHFQQMDQEYSEGSQSVSGYICGWVNGGAVTSLELNLWLMHGLGWAAGDGVRHRVANQEQTGCQHQELRSKASSLTLVSE